MHTEAHMIKLADMLLRVNLLLREPCLYFFKKEYKVTSALPQGDNSFGILTFSRN